MFAKKLKDLIIIGSLWYYNLAVGFPQSLEKKKTPNA